MISPENPVDPVKKTTLQLFWFWNSLREEFRVFRLSAFFFNAEDAEERKYLKNFMVGFMEEYGFYGNITGQIYFYGFVANSLD